jgi:hypothetical protein
MKRAAILMAAIADDGGRCARTSVWNSHRASATGVRPAPALIPRPAVCLLDRVRRSLAQVIGFLLE